MSKRPEPHSFTMALHLSCEAFDRIEKGFLKIISTNGVVSVWKVFLLFYVIWFAANASAFFGAWWLFDDFLLYEYSRAEWLAGSLHQGRPIFGFLLQLIPFEHPPDAVIMNRILRGLQGAIHVGAATALFALIRPFISAIAAIIGITPFLLWGLNGEATLWRAAIMYPSAALISTAGVYFVVSGWNVRRPGMILAGWIFCIVAPLTNQAAITVGIMAYAIVITLRSVANEFDVHRALREIGTATTGFIIGAAISAALTFYYNSTRGGFADDFSAKMEFLYLLNRNFLVFEDIYYPVVGWLHLILLLGAVLIWAAMTYMKILRGWAIPMVPLCMLGGLIIPYSANLVIAENYPSLRIMYAAPMLITASAVLAWRMAIRYSFIRAAILGIVTTLALFYASLAWQNGEGFVQLYEKDVAQAQAIADYAREHGTSRFAIVDLYQIHDPNVNRNPYKMRFSYLDHRYPVFLFSWAAPSFLRWHTELEPVKDIDHAWVASFIADLPREPSLQWYYIDDLDLVLIVPR